MKVVFTSRFNRDLKALREPTIRTQVGITIDEILSAASLTELKGLKKLSGADNAFRLRVGDYRIGLLFIEDTVFLARFGHRKDIYRRFP